MRAFVFTDASLARRAGQFVWLSLDTEKAGNAAAKKRLDVGALPTFFVLDEKTERAALRWVGGATVPQLQKILDDGRRAAAAGGGSGKGPDAVLARADRTFARGNYAESAKLYREAIDSAPPGWKPYGRAVESLLFALSDANESRACALMARDAWPKLEKTSSAANIASSGLSCALDLKPEDPDRAALVDRFRKDTLAVVRSGRGDIAADDISGCYQVLEDDRGRANDPAGKKELLREHVAFLEKEAAAATGPQGRAVYDAHRTIAYIDMGEPERAVPMLEQSEKDFPEDYNAPARLANAFYEMKKYDEAAAASDRALAKAYGPRKIGILQRRSDIEAKRNDPAASRRYLEEALQLAESLPEGQRSERTIAALKKKLSPPPS
jgi:tetratricopeptide (TPR) repeat protein